MKQKLEGVPVCCGVDWITVTQRPCDEMDLLREQAFALAAVELSSGNFGRPWRVSGYEGFSVGGVFYGERFDGCILQLTGPTASAHWRRAYENSCSVTRIDLQVTVRVSEDPKLVISRHWKEIRRRAKRMRRPEKHRRVIDETEAVTVYCGAPSSDRSGRIYDKGRQSKQKAFERCVRYESVVRGNVAKSVGFSLFSRGANHSQIALRSLAFFTARGCSVGPIREQFHKTASIDDLIYPVSPSSLEKKSAWLRTQVGPTVRLIADRIGKSAVEELLGLH